MTEPGQSHRYFDELAAGYALGALEPAEQREFVGHLQQCPDCERALAGYAEVTSAVAEAVPAVEPGPDLRERILAAAASEPRAAETGVPGASRPAPMHRRPSRRTDSPRPGTASGRQGAARPGSRRWAGVLAAAAAVVIAGGATWGVLASRTGSTPQAPLSSCVQARQCTEVDLTAAHGHRTAARLVVRGQTVWLLPGSLPADDTSRQVYVLWQITGAHIPLSVGSFDIRPGTHGPVKVGTLATPYRGTWAFAVSLEHGRTIPGTPSQPVALGQVSV
jgi:anti-sigma-K factor RskA